ncbi:MAG: response regulator transcription factor [Meiothermus sp.]|uniref:response regulator transcription factor n=1 Tax=Meiothermus sp. TaxID=1955249 RepID=UPI0025F2F960|nr:response regulator transcription factor [Meiothermus sp.]MCS7058180.1 response regulator transcription factor [Meiothermus sp.]MCS7193305.1 response regulator transcription factor [Meiothermus sp.]MCX7741557.1 response regulator transcription factor [Meiothermus sp.]MDW8091198.1 response regulator transcription factor [Meiothermus sp.]MDW8482016.1 response regulator transcription factor [Meiothermus sp.]
MRLLVADDHPLFRMGLRVALEREGFSVVGEAADGQEAVEQGLALLPDGVLLDVRMPRMDGIAATKALREGRYRGLIALLTTFSEPVLVQQAAYAGADAYWSKELPPEVLAERLRRLERGLEPRLRAPELPRLSPREQQVLAWVAQGLSTKEMARLMGISPETVKDHLVGLYDKLGARNRVEALERARALGLL